MHGVTSSPFYLPKAPVVMRRRRTGLRNNSVLSLYWVHGAMHASVFRRHVQVGSWSCATTVLTLPDFEAALDEALGTLNFSGSDVSLILEHEQFQHRTEQAPAFSEAATRAFLKGVVSRLEEQQGPILWVSQRTHSVRNEASVLLHLLAGAFYDQLNGIMLARRLELTRIVPLVVPLQRLTDELPEASDQPVLIATPAGNATLIRAGQAGKPLLFSRCILARWDDEPARIATEINRSLLYARQQFGTTLSRVRLLGSENTAVTAEVIAKCPPATDVSSHPSSPEKWLHAISQLSARPCVNLVAGYLRHKQRQRLIRRALVGLACLGLVFSALDVIQDAQRSSQEQRHLASLRSAETSLVAERTRLLARNATALGHSRLVQQIELGALPPVPVRFVAFLANTLPANARLTNVTVRARDDAGGWTMRVEGLIEADEESAREALAGLERQLARSVFRVRIPDTGRGVASLQQPSALAAEALRFVLEGGLLEN